MLQSGRQRSIVITAALGVGVLIAVQSRLNADLAGSVGSGLVAACVSFGTGLVLAAGLILSRSRLRAAFRSIPEVVAAGRLSWWQLLGGIAGAWLVTTQGLVVGVLGVTVFTVGVVAGQVGGSLLVDRAGLSPAGHMPLSGPRVVAAGVAMAAVVASGWQSGGTTSVSWLVLLALSAGFGASVQQAINGRVAAATGEPLSATLVNFVVGLTALLLVTGVSLAAGLIAFGRWPEQWWLYLGGPIGVGFIALAAWAVRGVGVLVFGLLSIAGQLLGAVLLDLLAPGEGAALGWPQWLAIALILLAALVATNGGRVSRLRGR
ncbi:MAG TPA: DMT family transporter [Actinomycetota bacterium]|nr:DMT family transporter [Actinomycetota bacterium]